MVRIPKYILSRQNIYHYILSFLFYHILQDYFTGMGQSYDCPIGQSYDCPIASEVTLKDMGMKSK